MAKSTKQPQDHPSSLKEAEDELIALAIEQAREQLKNGTASASTLNYYLKLAGSRERIEREVLENQIKLLEAKARSIERSETETQAYLDAIEVMKNYGYQKPS